MNLKANMLWLIPVMPLLVAFVLSLVRLRRLAPVLSIVALGVSFLLSIAAFAGTLKVPGIQYWNFEWMQFGSTSVKLGFILDPLAAIMLLMVTFVGLLIFIYSAGYMAHDPRYEQFFCFMSLFAGGMLGVLIANSLLLLFICWEIVGLASYLLIGFWFYKPSAAAAAQKAFITTRIGDVGLFLGMILLYSKCGTLLFYDGGNGCLEYAAMDRIVLVRSFFGIGAATLVALLIFCGAAGKSGQVPLHVWLPDAMEGPTPVSALIHAATMVAAGVFLIARVYPLVDLDYANIPESSHALTIIAWTGAITALFAALIATAQSDIKRILAYSTISQLGYMMLGLATGGVAVGIFHLLTHAFFKALLFLGAGSVIHGCGDEQDIYKMGGLRKQMPITFATYAIGMMALSGVPVLFSGFWSKDEILHSAWLWDRSKGPFALAIVAALLTAFYMTRQMLYIFFGSPRVHKESHESPRLITVPLIILAGLAVCFGFFGTPAWPWIQTYLADEPLQFDASNIFNSHFLLLASASTIVVLMGVGLGWHFYKAQARLKELDPVEARFPVVFRGLRERLYIDEGYELSIIRFTRWLAGTAARLELEFFGKMGRIATHLSLAIGWISRIVDHFIINLGFERSCSAMRKSAFEAGSWQTGKVQDYLRVIALTVIALFLLLAWGCKGA